MPRKPKPALVIVPGTIGMRLAEGEVAITSSGRHTTPFPRVKGCAARLLTRVNQWLIDNAVAEAEARGDDFNAPTFRTERAKTVPQASKDCMEEYLFGQQPALVRSIFKS